VKLKPEELPDIPNGWVDFIHGTHPGLPLEPLSLILRTLTAKREKGERPACAGDRCIQSFVRQIPEHSGRAADSLERLRRRGSVVVLANIEQGFFGGTLAQILKCLTAARICSKLCEHSIDAVAVGWIRSTSGKESEPCRPLRLLDAERELHMLGVRAEGENPAVDGNVRLFDTIKDLVTHLEDTGKEFFNPGILSALRTACECGDGQSSPDEIFLREILDPLGIIAVDPNSYWFHTVWEQECIPALLEAGATESANHRVFQSELSKNKANDYFLQCFALPVVAWSLGPYEPEPVARTLASFETCGVTAPFAWPAVSATLVDADSRRTLRKYQVGLQELFEGETGLLRRLKEQLPGSSIGDRFDALKAEVQLGIDGLDESGPDRISMRKAKKRCRERILFQLDKIENRFDTVGMEKRRVMNRRIHRACNSLAPGGKTQESRLSALYFLLRHSDALLEFLYERLELEPCEHQTVEIF